jgi:hypothetical protein
LDVDTLRKQEDAARKHREDELRHERDFQEKMLRLKEKFLFDLEDALHERDARQILRLIRRYNLEKTQLEREGENEQKDRDERYQQELDDIQKWRERRRQELLLEFQRRQADIALQAEREREDAKRARDRAREELMEDIKEEHEDRLKEYGEQLEEIRKKFKEKLTEIVDNEFEDFEGSTADFVKEITNLLNGAFGANGVAEGIFDNLALEVADIMAIVEANALRAQALAQQMAQTSAITNYAPIASPGYPGQEQSNPWGFAEGGTIIAHKPTTALFGEAGPEMATFIPLSKMSAVFDSIASDPKVGSPQMPDGSMTVKLLLPPGFEAEIIDNTLNVAGMEILDIIGVKK